MPTIAVTGAGGYIGSCLTARLIDAGHEVVPLDDHRASAVRRVRGVEIPEVDVRDREAMRDVVADADAVAHLAAVSDVPACDEHPDEAFDVNVRGTETVAWACREAGVPLAFAGSAAELGQPASLPITADHPRDPLNLYGLTKAMSEEDVHWLAEDRFPAHVLLMMNLYGRHRVDDQSIRKRTVVEIFVTRALEGEPLLVHEPGTQTFNFVHVRDVARAWQRSVETLLDADDGAETLVLGSEECYSVAELADLVRRVVAEERGFEPEVRRVDNPREAEAVAEDFEVDTTAVEETLGFEPEHTVEDTIRGLLRQ